MPAAEVTLAVEEASSGAEAAGEAADAAMADTGTKRRRPPKPTSKSSPRTTEAVVHWKRRCLISALHSERLGPFPKGEIKWKTLMCRE